MIDKIVIAFLLICMALFTLLMGAGMLKDAGMIDGLFSDKADEIRAETALKRVDVEMMKEKANIEEKRYLLEKATEPRTPFFVQVIVTVLCCGCIVLMVRHMKEKQRREYAEYKIKLISGQSHHAALSGPKYSIVDTKEKFYDARDRERG